MALATIHLSSAWYRPGLSLLVIGGDRVIVFESHLPWDHCVLLLTYNAARFMGARSASRYSRQ